MKILKNYQEAIENGTFKFHNGRKSVNESIGQLRVVNGVADKYCLQQVGISTNNSQKWFTIGFFN